MLEVALELSHAKLLNSSAKVDGLEKAIYDWKYKVIEKLADQYTEKYIEQYIKQYISLDAEDIEDSHTKERAEKNATKQKKFREYLIYTVYKQYKLSIEDPIEDLIKQYLESSTREQDKSLSFSNDIERQLILVNLLKNLADDIITTQFRPDFLNIADNINEEKRTELYAILLKKLYDAEFLDKFVQSPMQYNVFVIKRDPFSAVMLQQVNDGIEFIPFTSPDELVKEYKRKNNYAGLLLAFIDFWENAQLQHPETNYFLFKDKLHFSIPHAIFSSSSWKHTLEHAKRQQERGGDGFWYKKTEFAKQKESLLEFLENISKGKIVVDSDFWLTVEAQAFYTGSGINPEQFPFLGAFHSSPRHSSQTVERYKEIKNKWHEKITVESNKKISDDTDDLRVKLSNEKKERLVAKITGQINALEMRLRPPSNERILIFHRKDTLEEQTRLSNQKKIFETLQQFLFPNVESGEKSGLAAEHWVITRSQLMQLSPNKTVIETFNEIYEAWHEEAILTMQENMGLSTNQNRKSVSNKGF